MLEKLESVFSRVPEMRRDAEQYKKETNVFDQVLLIFCTGWPKGHAAGIKQGVDALRFVKEALHGHPESE